MKKRIIFAVIIFMFTMAGCRSKVEEVEPKEEIKNEVKKENKVQEKEENKNIIKIENTENIDFSELTYLVSEKERNEKLEKAILKTFEIEDSEIDFTYYYNYIDLNGDGEKEVFVILTGPYFSGSGGSTGVIFSNLEEKYEMISEFSLVRDPIIISDEKTNGWNEIIIYVSGGGMKPAYAVMQHDGEKYPKNPSTQPKLLSEYKIKGAAIIATEEDEENGIRYLGK